MLFNKNKNFCDINPFFYMLAQKKGILVRHIKDLIGGAKFAKQYKRKIAGYCDKSFVSSYKKRKWNRPCASAKQGCEY